MAASSSIYVGTGAKGKLGLSDNTVTGLVIDDISFETVTQEHEYLDINGDVTTCAYDKHEVNITINGRVLDGTPLSQTVAAAITLATVQDHLPAAYASGGSTVVSNIKHDEAISEYQKISITAKHYPKLTAS